MNATEVKELVKGFAKSVICEETFIGCDADDNAVELDVISLHIADFEGEVCWQVCEKYASLKGADNFMMLGRDNGTEFEDGNGSYDLDGVIVERVYQDTEESQNYELYNELTEVEA